MAHEYSWAQNQMKLARAIATVKDRIKAGIKIDDVEEAVKAEYVKYLGVVLDLDTIAEQASEDAVKAKKEAEKAQKEAEKAEARAKKEAEKAQKNKDAK